MTEKLILFDIDGTLINVMGAGKRAFVSALRLAFGDATRFESQMQGKTDYQILDETLRLNSLTPSDPQKNTFWALYTENLKSELATESRKYIYPGVPALLRALSQTNGLHLALLTGNIEEGARIKLQEFALFDYFRFGAYGTETERTRLGPIALELARRIIEKDFQPDSVIVIGDTPNDISCGKAIGAKTIGVAGTRFSCQELSDCGASWVFPDFSQTTEVLKVILPGPAFAQFS